MSANATLKIGKFDLWNFKNYLDEKIVSLLFSKNDLKVTYNYKSVDDDYTYTKYEYSTVVKHAKERLDALGYGINNFKKEFEEKKCDGVNCHPYVYHTNGFIDYDKEINREFVKSYGVTFRKWSNSLKKIVNYQIKYGSINKSIKPNNINIRTNLDKIIYYSLVDDMDYNCSYYGINLEVIDIGYVLRLLLKYFDENEEINIDFTDIIDYSEESYEKALTATENIEKTIILVEGKFDKRIIEYALKNLYPHLENLFYIMDFDDSNGNTRAGSASYLSKNLKTFYFSKFKSRFIGIFDNDAEGYRNVCSLLKSIKEWPTNFRILLYPDIDYLHNYPTIASNEKTINDNINHKAASIELYLPDRFIKPNNKHLPIIWKSREFIKHVNDGGEYLYQGEIKDKEGINKQFNEYIKKEDNIFNPKEWEHMKLLVDSIIFAFNKEQPNK